MHGLEKVDLGTHRGDEYFLKGFVEPEPSEGEDFTPDEDAENYGVSLARSTRSHETNIEIVRMDTTHGQPHMDRVYLPPDTDEERKVWLEEGYAYERMRQYLLANWEDFADRYIKYNE